MGVTVNRFNDIGTLGQHAARRNENDLVTTRGDQFEIKSGRNPLGRLITWIKSKILPLSQTRHVTQVRQQFIEAIKTHRGQEHADAAREILGKGKEGRQPLRMRQVKQVFNKLDEIDVSKNALRSEQPADVARGGQAPTSATASPGAILEEPQAQTLASDPLPTSAKTPPGPVPDEPPAQTLAFAPPPASVKTQPGPIPGEPQAQPPTFDPLTVSAKTPPGATVGYVIKPDPNAKQWAVNAQSPNPLPKGGRYYREMQPPGSGLCGMHALNAFCGGPVVGEKEYMRLSIDHMVRVQRLEGADADRARQVNAQSFASDPGQTGAVLAELARQGRISPSFANPSMEMGVTFPKAAQSPGSHAAMRDAINAFPGDRLIVGYFGSRRGHAGHLIALRRDQSGGWQQLNSLNGRHEAPRKFDNLADALLALPEGLSIIHAEPGFQFRSAVPEAPRPVLDARNLANAAFFIKLDPNASQRAVNPLSPDPLPKGQRFYREVQEGGSGLAGMHALNAFCGGPVVAADEFKRISIDDMLIVEGFTGSIANDMRAIYQAADFQSAIPQTAKVLAELAKAGRISPSAGNPSVEAGLLLPDPASNPEAHRAMRDRINAFPGDRLMVSYEVPQAGTHIMALRRDQRGEWQVLNSLNGSSIAPKQARNLADFLQTLPGKLSIIHTAPNFRFGNAAPETPQPAPQPPPPPEAPASEAGGSLGAPPPVMEQEQPQQAVAEEQPQPTEPASEPSGSLDMPPPIMDRDQLRRAVAGQQPQPTEPASEPDDSLDLPPPIMDRDQLQRAVAGRAALGDSPALQPYMQMGFSPAEAQRLMADGVGANAAASMMDAIARRGDSADAAFQSGIPLNALSGFYDAGYGLEQAALLHNANISPQMARSIYQPHFLAVTPDSVIAFTDANVAKRPSLLGVGGFNAVYEVDYNDGTSRVFKPLDAPDMVRPLDWTFAGEATGINPYDPQFAMRNLATSRLADELGFDVIAGTQLGYHAVPLPSVPGRPPQMTAPQLGLVMDRAPGRLGESFFTADPDVFEAPEARKELTKLQLLDALTAQGDRHAQNYFIQRRPNGGIKVTGIDNDVCFGERIHHPAQVRQAYKDVGRVVYHSCNLPPVVDTEMAAAIERLTPQRLGELIGDKLTQPELQAAADRLAAIQQHIAGLRRDGAVIAPNDWAQNLNLAKAAANNSYFARESALAAGQVHYGADDQFRRKILHKMRTPPRR